jgi:hypothetical protein
MRVSRPVRVLLYSLAGLLLGFVAIAAFLAIRFQPIAREYFIAKLRERYQSDVELGKLTISLIPVVRATGDNLVFRFNGRRDVPPLVQIRRFNLEAGFISFFRDPKHINRLRLEGLRIQVPPRTGKPESTKPSAQASPFVLDEVTADGTTLEIAPKDPEKEPLRFEIQRLTLRTAGIGQPMTFRAELTNAKPPGLIHSDGEFGPWNAEQPGSTKVSGNYTFRDADLSVFKGITGILSSDGKYSGQLDRIEVEGTTDVPGFALTIARHPMPLHTDFEATVDGVNGNTNLHPVRARLGRSSFEVSGAIERSALEKHKTTALAAKAAAARLEDFLRLSVKGKEPPLTGAIGFNTKVRIPPGEKNVVERMQLDGMFALTGVQFTSPVIQQKIASLSHHAQGDPKDHDPDVRADFAGRFRLLNGELGLPDLRLNLPGAAVDMHGSYTLQSGALDFEGTARLDATVSQMTTGVKHVLLKPVDPLFRRDGAGAVVPIVISGTRGEPSFKLDIGRVLKRK